MNVTVKLLETIFLFLSAILLSCSVVNSSPNQHVICLNSTGYYDNQTARLALDLNLHIVTSNAPAIIMRVTLKLLDYDQHVGNTSSLFAVSSTERFQYIETINSDTPAKENATVFFDHVYTGHYKLKVEGCRNRFSCSQKFHESDLGFLHTSLNNIDVAKMNISISTTPTDIGGIDVAFTVHYFNDSCVFLPFEEYMVTLVPSDGTQQVHYRKVIGKTKAEFRPCSALVGNHTADSDVGVFGCVNLTNGQYTTRIDPIDSRCNFPEQIVASIKRPCRRYIVSNVTIIPIRLRREENDVLNLSKKSQPFGTHSVLNGELEPQYCSSICRFLNFIFNIF